MTKKLTIQPSPFLFYTTPDGQIEIDVFIQDETVWLSQKSIANLFDCSVDNVSLHLKNIFKSEELAENQVVEDFSITADDNKKYKVKHYNLDAIISVGYRVNSLRGTQFRVWATQQLKEFIIKGFVLDDERLKNPQNIFGKDYFEQVLEKIRDIRSSERRFYQKITDIYATSIDYYPNAELTKNFFAVVQNKMHFGINGKTAAEVISQRTDSNKPNMGITCISEKKLKKSDIFIAKNYLTENEIKELNLIVDQYLSFAELQARNNITMTMKNWVEKLDDFLRLNEKEILQHKGSISKNLANKKAEKEFNTFKSKQSKKYRSDFDKIANKYLKK